MVEWRTLRTTPVRPVPEPIATPFVWAATFAGCLLLMAVLSAAGAPPSPSVMLIALGAWAMLLGLPARFRAAPGIAVVCWLFLNDYAVTPRGQLAWQGDRDIIRLLLLLAAAVLGTVIARITNAIGAHHHVTPGHDME
ncbi:hypothetical protein [Streptomyces sp. MK7]|uniref:hypothetical protein n=1 Tax=Streptomyces sp. MK7 TaxID=3067635 RepID=UPI00292DC532|nr:hypothetical protein [Streptomyces sp. MK7]